MKSLEVVNRPGDMVANLGVMMSETESRTTAVARRVVCAANRCKSTGEIILGIRHYDEFMRVQVASAHGFRGDGVDQGFVDQRGAFMTRKEAWEVAEQAGQILRRCGGDDTDGGCLYSENLY